ncbi:unnamed protein product, partial [marine sediment metagenome]
DMLSSLDVTELVAEVCGYAALSDAGIFRLLGIRGLSLDWMKK